MMLEMILGVWTAPAHISSAQELDITPSDGRDSSKLVQKTVSAGYPLRIYLVFPYGNRSSRTDYFGQIHLNHAIFQSV